MTEPVQLRRRRALTGIAVMVLLSVAVSACGRAEEVGTVTGIGSPCGGPDARSGLPGWLLQPVTVSAVTNGRTVASDVVTYRSDRDRYRLSLRPGKYAIVSVGDPHGIVVTVQAGQRITVNLPDLCS